MSGIAGDINDSIELINKFRELALKYRDAEDSQESISFFHSQLGSLRLDLGLEDSSLDAFRSPQKANETLRKSTTQTRLGKLKWALWGKDSVTGTFEDINKSIDILQSLVTLGRLAPKRTGLNPDNDGTKFKLYDFSKNATRLEDAPLGYHTKADWRETDPTIRVFVESYRDYDHVPKSSENPEDPRRRQDDRIGTREEPSIKKARLAPEKLWWTLAPPEGSGVPTGVLPCIGFDKYRLISLLPENSKDIQTLRQLIQNKDSGVSLDFRVSLALQLAEAVLKVHSAGLSHCAIRSNTIMFITPSVTMKSQGSKTTQADTESDHIPTLRRTGTMKSIRDGTKNIVRRLTGKLLGGAKDQDQRQARTRDRSDASKNRDDSRPRGHGKSFGFRKNKNGEDYDVSDIDDDNSGIDHITEKEMPKASVGEIPPGSSGILYLFYWSRVCLRGDTARNLKRYWDNDLYRHPKQQGDVVGNPTWDMTSIVWEKVTPAERLIAKIPDIKRRKWDNDKAGLVKRTLVEIAEQDLPKTMGERYAKVVVACLTCLDENEEAKSVWNRHKFSRNNLSKDVAQFRRVISSFLLEFSAQLAATDEERR
ncbi:hypothetical protein QBC35DRAFT_535710 [Podospora australis]|uniref:Protein kinase domain-containing protein n=1 Tax=Podospora australis TaxID=1536484 RepID=A0AAN6WJX0_9PEZI|nr:hypothetical protein QBC35DRAFT_535710 [Podospora australis]